MCVCEASWCRVCIYVRGLDGYVRSGGGGGGGAGHLSTVSAE